MAPRLHHQQLEIQQRPTDHKVFSLKVFKALSEAVVGSMFSDNFGNKGLALLVHRCLNRKSSEKATSSGSVEANQSDFLLDFIHTHSQSKKIERQKETESIAENLLTNTRLILGYDLMKSFNVSVDCGGDCL
eukprot:GHVN01025903.1.p1 GENE.GHVN01025903.1~~GHVN01025903.1.p1  ORF type:complete len:132 (+),score=16.91 GHVN01025903.1:218-613(+)